MIQLATALVDSPIMLQTARNTTADSSFFVRELARFGPHQSPVQFTPQQAEEYCRRFAAAHYENFTVASWLLPKRLRQDFCNIYAYCRWSDDLADEIPQAAESLALLDWWQQQLELCYGGRPSHPIMLGLQQTIEAHQLPIEPLSDLLSAFRQDQSVARYQSDQELEDYCTRSANPVGRVLLHLAQASTPENLALSDHICTGLQLANFCQDMSRDASMNRIYAPRSLWADYAVDEAMLLARQACPQLRRMLAAWVAQSRTRFDQGRPLIRQVPAWLATDVELFLRGGLAILDKIEQLKFDVWSQRPTLSKLGKMRILASALGSRLWQRGGSRD